MGGAPSVPSTTSSTTTVEPWEGSQRYLEDALRGVSRTYGKPGTQGFVDTAVDRVVGFSPQTQAALDATEMSVLAGNPDLTAARSAAYTGLGVAEQGMLSTPAFGEMAAAYIDPNTGRASTAITADDALMMNAYGNPYADVALLSDTVGGAAMSAINADAARAGRVGSGLHQNAMAQGVASALAPFVQETQQAALDRGVGIYSDGAARSADMSRAVMGLANDQFGTSATMASTMGQLMPGYRDAEMADYARLGTVGSMYEQLADAQMQAPYDQLSQYIGQVGTLSGLGGSTQSHIGTASQGGGGFGLSQGLGALMGVGTLASAFGAFG